MNNIKKYIILENGNKKLTRMMVVNSTPTTFITGYPNGAPYRIRIGVTAVRGRCPRPLDEGSDRFGLEESLLYRNLEIW